ncbi:MAG TPA: aspartate/glutamate racemase family protein [Pyrinomonadaceae bacterium]|jgi:aspartate racemase
MTQTNKRSAGAEVLGVLGGMGPLSSAEFLRTIYECAVRDCGREQEAPAVLLYSDPAFPDRTEAFLAGREEEVLARLNDALRGLYALGATRVVMCCMTIHHLLPRVPEELRGRVASLPAVIGAELRRRGGRHLMLCSTGTRRLGLFESQPGWDAVAGSVVFPDAEEQERLHSLIYEIKKDRAVGEASEFLESLMGRHQVTSFIAGCSEIHMLAKQFLRPARRRRAYDCIDPFAVVAQELAASR